MRTACQGLGLSGPAILVMDENTGRAAGERLGRKLSPELETITLPAEADGRVHASSDVCQTVIDHADRHRARWMLAVGAGTINDITKFAADRLGLPYITVPTAASMNGYTSTVAALLSNGFKQTLEAEATAAVC